MKTISMGDLRADLLDIINEVKKGKSILVTSHGKPVAQLNPPSDRRKEAIAKLKAMRKTAIIGDVVSPTGEVWEAN